MLLEEKIALDYSFLTLMIVCNVLCENHAFFSKLIDCLVPVSYTIAKLNNPRRSIDRFDRFDIYNLRVERVKV